MIRRPPRSTPLYSSAASDVYKRQGYLVHRKPTRTNNGQVMYFGTWLDMDGQWIDTVHFPNSNNKNPFTGPGCYFIRGKVVDAVSYTHLRAHETKANLVCRLLL